jgi:hypothetical protein
MATLLASLLLNYNSHRYGVWLIEIQDSDSGHLAVAFPVNGGNLTILDPAGNYYTGYLTGSLHSESITAAVQNWLAYWSKEMPGVAITAVFSDDFYREFSGTPAFIDWAENRNTN